ncbi:hypothetical protein GWC77_27850 [Paraburkholderia sp. NMBU_R16]|uniref:hypothetical protein n=1 Tax=Paraburkholderia sp. NMBU_R16 TaxID=2698676 RepID=UPI0015647FD2|nr:hypothetical protein [Paraburkholderia sp. NMBU_R16]NRO99662.1 hypothetical protein [Paraburkholderia sp. NMBU_R16]
MNPLSPISRYYWPSPYYPSASTPPSTDQTGAAAQTGLAANHPLDSLTRTPGANPARPRQRRPHILIDMGWPPGPSPNPNRQASHGIASSSRSESASLRLEPEALARTVTGLAQGYFPASQVLRAIIEHLKADPGTLGNVLHKMEAAQITGERIFMLFKYVCDLEVSGMIELLGQGSNEVLNAAIDEVVKRRNVNSIRR